MRSQTWAVGLLLLVALTGCTTTSPPASRSTTQHPTPSPPTPSTSISTMSKVDSDFVDNLGTVGAAFDDPTLITAAHMVCDDLAANQPGSDVALQMETTLDMDGPTAAEFANAARAAYCPDTAAVTAPPSISVAPPPPPAPDTITLKVTGNGGASSITYSDGTNIEQATDVRLPWSKTIPDNGDFYQVSAQDANGDIITCEMDESALGVIDKHTATGPYAIASCSATGIG